MKYKPVIGLEIHIELSTKSKMFCSCSAGYFAADPNTHTCPICLGLPGAMPVPNKKAIEFTQKFALALGCQLELSSKFDRKNYFYPDLPKGFQISQYDLPFSRNGSITIRLNGKDKKVRITRVHLEEDTAKLTHAAVNGKRVTLIDFNRSGVPLVEIVSEPDMKSSEEAKNYSQKIQQIARYLTISDADMEKGSMRIEPNVSLGKSGDKSLPEYKVELKNINSFKFAQKAINYEIKRQSEMLDRGQTPTQETRGWNEQKSQTYSQRTKELAHDYRYFPEPDIPPFTFNPDYIIELQKELPELPDKKMKRFLQVYQLSDYDTEILTREIDMANYFEEAVRVSKSIGISPKQIANTIINKKIDINSVLPAELIRNVKSTTTVSTIDEKELEKVVKEVLEENKKAVEDYKKGKENVIMFLIGQVVRELKKKIETYRVKKIIEREIKK